MKPENLDSRQYIPKEKDKILCLNVYYVKKAESNLKEGT